MITQHNVLALLKQLTDLDDTDPAQALTICLSSLEQIRARLRPDAPKDDVRIAAAAAGLAYCTVCSRRSGASEVTGFKAGDISVQKSSQSAMTAARKVYDEALAALAPLMTDSGFMFCGVDICTV